MDDAKVSGQDQGMKVRDIILFIIWRCQDKLAFGRTSLQKVAYFVGRALAKDLGHRAHYYGPFASTIDRETQALVLSELVEERVQSLGFANAAGFEAKQYEYKVSASGKERVERLQSQYPDETAAIDRVVSLLSDNSRGLDQRVLSAAAKVDYVAGREGRPVTAADVSLAAQDLGWRLDPGQVAGVMDLLRKLGFVDLINEPS